MSHLDERAGMTALSASHYYTAQLLLEASEKYASKESSFRHSHFVIPALFIFHALIDSYLNEYLALRYALKGEPDDDTGNTKRLIASSLNRQKLDQVIAFLALPNFDQAILDDIEIIFDLRNILYHYEASMSPMTEYPQAAHRFVVRSGIPVVNSGWITAIACVESLRWIDSRVEIFIAEFSKWTGWHNPYPDRPIDKGGEAWPGWKSTFRGMAAKVWN